LERTLSNFVRALRNADIRVSTAETLDAMSAVDLVGYEDREFLKRSLSLVLPKTPDEKATFDACFDQFFAFKDVRGDEASAQAERDGQDSQEGEEGEGGDGEGGGSRDPNAPPSGRKKKSKAKAKKNPYIEEEEEEDLGPGEMTDPSSKLGQLLMSDSRTELTMAMANAGEEVEVREIKIFTQKGLYTRRIMDAMGLPDLNREISDLRDSPAVPARRLGQQLKQRRDFLREQVRDYVERQFMLNADVSGKRLREDMLKSVKLSNVEVRNFRLIQEMVYKMAKKLSTMYSRRKKVFKRGQLNISRTLRRNMSYDGAIFNLHWKSVKVDRPKVFAICDVSGSVANYARFMLMFLYSMDEVMPKVRSFAFSSDLAEVTELFNRNKIQDAIAKTLRDYSGGSTDYGQALLDFKRLCLDDIDNRTTIIILGDARNNFGENHTEVLKELYDRSKRVIWLNPESKLAWNTGDSVMRNYSAYVHQAEECNSLMHLERVVSNLLKLNG
tara:strand:+ start:2105 stop:3601 length:1497 start_codon:yes stop_codon:yes gene_type:complete